MTAALHSPAVLTKDDPLSSHAAFESGVQVFSRMFVTWMDGNGWSHPVMASLANACLGGKGWLHSSQINSFRHGSATNPGPRTFAGVERLNYYVWRYREKKLLLPNTTSSNHYSNAQPITENGQPPSLGWFVEVFCGYRLPLDYSFSYTTDLWVAKDKAQPYSRALGRLIRQLMTAQGMDVVEDLPHLLEHQYPHKDPNRLKQLSKLVLTGAPLTADVLTDELPNLAAITKALYGPPSADALLEQLASE